MPPTADDEAEEVRPRSLREEKKAQTRRALVHEAMSRFLSQGYEATTLEEIAAAVPVSLRTLLRYFESKERLFHAGHYSALKRFERELAERPADQSALAFWRSWVERFSSRVYEAESSLPHRLMQESEPSLHAHWLTIMRHYEDRLTEALVQEVGAGRRLEARLAAVALVGGNEAVIREWAASDPRGDINQACLEVVDLVDRLFSPIGISLERAGRERGEAKDRAAPAGPQIAKQTKNKPRRRGATDRSHPREES